MKDLTINETVELLKEKLTEKYLKKIEILESRVEREKEQREKDRKKYRNEVSELKNKLRTSSEKYLSLHKEIGYRNRIILENKIVSDVEDINKILDEVREK